MIKIKHLLLLGMGLIFSWSASGQQALPETPEVPGNSATVTAPTPTPTVTDTKPDFTFTPGKWQYHLNMGTSFSNGFGSTVFIQPGFQVPLTKRFAAYGSLMATTYSGGPFNRFNTESGLGRQTAFQNQQYVLQVGGNYLVNANLMLSGSAWKTLKGNNLSGFVPNMYMPMGNNGLQLKAHYKVTDNFSISGGLRYSNGGGYNPGYYQSNFNPNGAFGF